MKKFIGKFMLFIVGWKFETKIPIYQFKKSVLICAPHTSNWDFYYCIACFWSLDIPFKFFIKDYYTKSLLGFIFKYMGAIGVSFTERTNLVEYTVNLLNNSENMVIINTPEGSRSWAKYWKKGFYHIAKQADVPVVVASADYKNKEAIIGHMITDIKNKSFVEVAEIIEPLYKPEMARYPEKYNPNIYDKSANS